MTEQPPKTDAQRARELMEESAAELNRVAEQEQIAREAGIPSATPIADSQKGSDDIYEIPPAHQVPPQQVVDEAGLGVK